MTPSRLINLAPMLDITDRHFRHLLRLLAPSTWLYTEMINSQAIIYGRRDEILKYSTPQHPIALQLGGSEAKSLGEATRIAEDYAYNEINLNAGCPSPRVQKGAFGAALMLNTPQLIQCLNAIAQNTTRPISLKHRIGIDTEERYEFLHQFIKTIKENTPCRIFIIHARNAWLNGLSPKENRDIPPLKYHYVHQIKKDFPELKIIINGGIKSTSAIEEQLAHCDGVMIGRAITDNPLQLHEWDATFYHNPKIPTLSLLERIIPAMHQYACAEKIPLRHITRHLLNLSHGLNGAKNWRRTLTDPKALKENNPDLILKAWQTLKQQNH